MRSGILFLVSFARATARRTCHGRPWLSELGHFRRYAFSVRCAFRLWRASVSSDRSAHQRGGVESREGRILTRFKSSRPD
jgi:hypothetical protein